MVGLLDIGVDLARGPIDVMAAEQVVAAVAAAPMAACWYFHRTLGSKYYDAVCAKLVVVVEVVTRLVDDRALFRVDDP